MTLISTLFFIYGGLGQKTASVFKGKLTYKFQKKIESKSGQIPPFFLQLEKPKFIHYFFNDSDNYWQLSTTIYGDTISISMDGHRASKVYSYRSKEIIDFTNIPESKSRNKPKLKRTGEFVDHLGYESAEYIYTSNSGDDYGMVYFTNDLNIICPYQYDEKKIVAFPISKNGLKTKSVITNKITDDLSWVSTYTLLSIDSTDRTSWSFPTTKTEIYEPIQVDEKDYFLIDDEDRIYVELDAENSFGENVNLTNLRGKYTYIDLWATWCQPCLVNLPFLNDLKSKYSPEKLNVVSISLDKKEDIVLWHKKSAKYSLTLPQLIRQQIAFF